MAESFVKKLKRDYAQLSDRLDSQRVIAQVPKWFDDYNSYHPHSELGYVPPKLFREKRAVNEIYRRYWATGSRPISAYVAFSFCQFVSFGVKAPMSATAVKYSVVGIYWFKLISVDYSKRVNVFLIPRNYISVHCDLAGKTILSNQLNCRL